MVHTSEAPRNRCPKIDSIIISRALALRTPKKWTPNSCKQPFILGGIGQPPQGTQTFASGPTMLDRKSLRQNQVITYSLYSWYLE